jgi:hypothetical protein
MTLQPELGEQEVQMSDKKKRDRLNACVASDAFSDFALKAFAEGVQRAIADLIAKGVIDPE